MREKAGMRERMKEARSVEGKKLSRERERERERGRELKREEVEEKTERNRTIWRAIVSDQFRGCGKPGEQKAGGVFGSSTTSRGKTPSGESLRKGKAGEF